MRANIYTCSGYYLLRKEMKKRWKPAFSYDADAQDRLEDFISQVPADKVFVHVALSASKLFSPVPDGYVWLKELLNARFQAIVTNAFTPYVKDTKTFDIKQDKPVYGAFAKKLFQEHTFRNADPLYSVCGVGQTGLDQNRFSFAPEGVFRQMIDQGYYGLNIDIDNIISSLLHFIEFSHQLPYIDIRQDTFRVISENKEYQTEYPYYRYKKKFAVNNKSIMFNRDKIIRDLLQASVLKKLSFKGATVSCFSYQGFYELLSQKLEKDPFYLITW